jgi:Icc-related predicted phosphoesterase
MTSCTFVSDLHGRIERYKVLLATLQEQTPSLLFIGGDLLPRFGPGQFIQDFLKPEFRILREMMKDRYPTILLIFGNDDSRAVEQDIFEGEDEGLWRYVHNRKVSTNGTVIYGYCCVPPTPFLLKDWERYDVSRYCDPGCISPEEGVRSIPVE